MLGISGGLGGLVSNYGANPKPTDKWHEKPADLFLDVLDLATTDRNFGGPGKSDAQIEENINQYWHRVNSCRYHSFVETSWPEKNLMSDVMRGLEGCTNAYYGFLKENKDEGYDRHKDQKFDWETHLKAFKTQTLEAGKDIFDQLCTDYVPTQLDWWRCNRQKAQRVEHNYCNKL